MIVYAVAVTVCATVRGVWRAGAWLRWRLRGELPPQAPEEPQTRRRRPVPSWAHTEPYDYDEAA